MRTFHGLRGLCLTLVVGALLFFLPETLRADRVSRVFDVLDYGAVGNGTALDTAAIQRAIEAAAAVGAGAQVRVRGGHRYLIGTLELRGGIDFHLDRGAELIISTNRADYASDGVLMARDAGHLRISGFGRISGRSLAFMTNYDAKGEWWLFAEWRPKMFVLTGCTNLEVRDITFGDAPYWGLHLLGCRNVLIDNVTIRNRLDVPNCDGIDPDHCQDVEIRNCHITCGDDAIVLKTTRQTNDFGPCSRIYVHDCVLATQDSGLKIGTETTQDISDVRFERCRIVTSSRGLTIQLRDEGSVLNVAFRDIKFVSRYYADPWWGRGEAISLTAIPRTSQTKLGTIHDVRFERIQGRAENSVRICGTTGSRIRDIDMQDVNITLGRWTSYPGRVFDNRPTTVLPPTEPHDTSAFFLRLTDNLKLTKCRVSWMRNPPEYFTFALEAEEVSGLKLSSFRGASAHPGPQRATNSD